MCYTYLEPNKQHILSRVVKLSVFTELASGLIQSISQCLITPMCKGKKSIKGFQNYSSGKIYEKTLFSEIFA